MHFDSINKTGGEWKNNKGHFDRSVCKTLNKKDYEKQSFKLQMRHDSKLQSKNERNLVIVFEKKARTADTFR